MTIYEKLVLPWLLDLAMRNSRPATDRHATIAAAFLDARLPGERYAGSSACHAPRLSLTSRTTIASDMRPSTHHQFGMRS
jgi:hypothetical protein